MLFRRKPDDRLRLLEVMRLRKAYLREPPMPDEAVSFEEAKRRCLACHVKKLCDETLAEGLNGAFGAFCPNSHYIQQVRSGSLRFR